jgi:phosphatidylserine/phosphatidylglycerophosphate/cardiolipin synthase-like enzyme
MPTDTVGVLGANVALVSDRKYAGVLLPMIWGARRCVWASIFMVDLAHAEEKMRVLNLLHDLAAARWRGVDVRLLIGGSRDNLDMAEASAGALAMARRLGLPSRWLTSRAIRGSHAKYVIADDDVLLGSHNWSSSAFSGSTQDSVFVQSAELAAYLADAFAAQWLRGQTTAP